MKKFWSSSLPPVAALVLLSLTALETHGATINQIGNPFAPTLYTTTGQEAGDSQFDSSVNTAAGDFSNFATAYDNFTFGSNLFITNFSWVGLYAFTPNGTVDIDDPPLGVNFQNTVLADSFTVSIYGDLAGRPNTPIGGTPTPLASFNAGRAGETLIGNDFYSYTFDLPTQFAVMADTEYWFSVVANLNADTTAPLNVWSLAFSDLGDGFSVQDFQTDAFLIERFEDTIDYAFSVTAIPEPGSVVVLGVAAITAGLRTLRRSRRKLAV